MSSELLDVTVYYLEMTAPPKAPGLSARQGVTVHRVISPQVPYYRSLYNAIGEQYRWLSRRKMTDEALAAIIRDERVEMHVLQVDGCDAGFAELDCRQPEDIELVQFGLLPRFVGQGLGKWFLHWTIDNIWLRHPQRFWLHTCSLDHPGALPNYQKAGFRLYRQETLRREY
jgi:GNAT superfamily N-acetyltransferase